ncbi:MAG: glycosyltransferase family 2 protein [Desulfonatronovibrio sp.]
MISVIIPTHNRAAFLERAVSSVLNQSFSQLELIIVDDGSTDETSRIVHSFEDKRVSYYYQENRGVSAARNLGLGVATGKFAALLDSDDYWLPGKLEQQLKFMKEGGFRISQTQELWIRKGKRVNPMNKHQKPCGWIFEKSLKLCLVSPSCVVMDMDLPARGYTFNEKLMACEDYDLWLRISLEYPFGLLPEALTVKTGGHPDQLSGKISGLDLFRIYSLLDLEKKSKLSADKKKLVRQVLLDKAMIYIKGCIKRGRFEEALRIRELLEGRGQDFSEGISCEPVRK